MNKIKNGQRSEKDEVHSKNSEICKTLLEIPVYYHSCPDHIYWLPDGGAAGHAEIGGSDRG